MTSLVCVSISFLLFFFLRETHGAGTFLIQFTGTITKEKKEKRDVKVYDPFVPRDWQTSEYIESNAGKGTEVTLYKDLGGVQKKVARTRVNWIGGKYKLEAEVPENEKNGDYKLIVDSPFSPEYRDVHYTFKLSDEDKNSFTRTWNTTLYEKV
ncbi:hypothetical protein DdX_18686 [Ditylenchus destructor]|uniref:Uncharacterized protein n=1 Tax=Ditylenchus destructor TaxID=166010 RepID=A0AAD4MJS3_9BILA|nr:hypothetical protein DdX_18686 [Ditylenchus destructor]